MSNQFTPQERRAIQDCEWSGSLTPLEWARYLDAAERSDTDLMAVLRCRARKRVYGQRRKVNLTQTAPAPTPSSDDRQSASPRP